MAKLVSKTYGEALFNVAIEENTLDMILDEVKLLMDAFEDVENLIKILNHPKIDKEEKLAVVENIFKGRLSDTLVGFLTIVVTKDRHNDLVDIFEYFINKVREHKNIGVAKVSSAVELSALQKAQIEKRLLDLTKHVKIEMNYKVDSSLIGGLVIRIGDRVVDSSIKTRLEQLAKDLSKIQLV